MSDTRYNGWKNYETWIFNLWTDHDYYREIAKDEGMDTYELSHRLEDDMEVYIDELGYNPTGVIADLVNASLSRVDYYEIAENILLD